MNDDASEDKFDDKVQRAVEALWRTDSRRVFATLVKLLRDFDLAEEAMQESFAAALTQWNQTGLPPNPRAWRDGPEAGLTLIDAILARGDLADYHLSHAARAELYRRAGRLDEARQLRQASAMSSLGNTVDFNGKQATT